MGVGIVRLHCPAHYEIVVKASNMVSEDWFQLFFKSKNIAFFLALNLKKIKYIKLTRILALFSLNDKRNLLLLLNEKRKGAAFFLNFDFNVTF